jgi:hypothetical protein
VALVSFKSNIRKFHEAGKESNAKKEKRKKKSLNKNMGQFSQCYHHSLSAGAVTLSNVCSCGQEYGAELFPLIFIF